MNEKIKELQREFTKMINQFETDNKITIEGISLVKIDKTPTEIGGKSKFTIKTEILFSAQ